MPQSLHWDVKSQSCGFLEWCFEVWVRITLKMGNARHIRMRLDFLSAFASMSETDCFNWPDVGSAITSRICRQQEIKYIIRSISSILLYFTCCWQNISLGNRKSIWVVRPVWQGWYYKSMRLTLQSNDIWICSMLTIPILPAQDIPSNKSISISRIILLWLWPVRQWVYVLECLSGRYWVNEIDMRQRIRKLNPRRHWTLRSFIRLTNQSTNR
jgi:hypothetical protein